MDLGISGRVALVTGASKGIGFGIAAELAKEGARVAIASSSRERIDAAASKIGAVGFVHDSRDLDAVPALIAAVQDSLGPIDILVCNTGGPPSGDPLAFTREQWRDAYTTLVLAPMALVEEVLPGMRERGFGRILNVVSTSVREPIANLMLSNTHRAAMITAFKTLAREVAADGVTLNSVLPGLIATERIEQLYGSIEQAAAAAAPPAGRLGTVDEIAAAAAFLCSQRASYISGETLAVDGATTRSV